MPFWQEKGEMLSYAVKIGFIPAGEAEFIFQPNTHKKEYQIHNRAWTYPKLSKLFKLNDSIHINGKMYPFPFASGSYEMQLNENDYFAHKKTEFDHQISQAAYKNIKDNAPVRLRKTPTHGRDIFSALYFLRNTVKNIHVGDTYTLPVMDITRNYTMHLNVLRKEKIHANKSIYNTFVMQVLLNGIANDKKEDNLFLWISDSPERLPVQFKIKMGIGSVTAKLTQRSYLTEDTLEKKGSSHAKTIQTKKDIHHGNLFNLN